MRNPIVARGRCRQCGQDVALFERDAADYLANPQHGLVHITCPLIGASTPINDTLAASADAIARAERAVGLS
jgi:hypothetical protein